MSLPADGSTPRDLQATIRTVEKICTEFQAAWHGNGHPQIEAYLKSVPHEDRGRLLSGLLVAELRHRFGRNEQPTAREYLARFPDFEREIRIAYELVHTDETVGSRDPKETTDALRVRCPYCHNMVDLVDGTEISEVICSACGSSFTLVGDEALATRSVGGTRHLRRSVGHFELIEQLGFGAFGAVWRARDKKLDRIVAVKIPRKGSLDHEETEKFLREARAAAQLNHPNIVSVHEVGIDDQLIYIVSDLIDGATLNDELTARQFTAQEAARICMTIAEALDYAHEKGIIHRDLKPSNIILGDSGRPYLMDFGLAKREVGEVTMTLDGQLLGTPAYMSPEQATGKGHQADRRSDIYSLGVVLFKLLTNELPFRGNAHMLLKQVIEDEAPSPRKLNNRVPRDLETICLKCLEKAPWKRYQSARELADELRRFLSGEPVQARPVGTLGKMWRWYHRHPESSAQVAGVYTAFCAILLIAWGLEGFVVYGLGIDRSPDAGSAMWEIAGAMLVVYLPLVMAGIQIIRGRMLALWLGFVAFLIGLTVVILGLTGVITFSGVFVDQRLRLGVCLLLGNLCFVGVVVNTAALLSRLIDRET